MRGVYVSYGVVNHLHASYTCVDMTARPVLEDVLPWLVGRIEALFVAFLVGVGTVANRRTGEQAVVEPVKWWFCGDVPLQ